MQNINFYDRSLRLKRDWLSAPTALATLAAVVLAVGAAAGLLHWQTLSLRAVADEGASALQAEQATLLALARKVGAMRPDAVLEQRLVAMQRTLDHHQAALQMLREGGLQRDNGYAQSLQALARQSIGGLWLTSVSLDRGDMALRGRSLRPELIPAYVERLRLEPALQGHAFRALDIRRPDAEPGPERDAAATAPADGPRAVPLRAPYVEFSLSGSTGASVAPAGGRL